MRLIFISAFVIVLLFYNFDYIQNVYLKNQLTHTGYIINGSIVGLFLLGMIKLVTSLLFYWREERAVEKFIVNVHKDNFNPAESINKKSMIYRRYVTMQEIYRQHAPVNQNALAATMVAAESTRLSLPKFVSNILILLGVFGTIISLSIALLGASNLMEDNGIASMGQVIHGMSTALSTTTTAIVCYLLFGYFYLKLTDVQTNLFSAIEQVTTIHLVPRFSHQSENMIHQLAELIKSLRHTAANMQLSQQQYLEMGSKVNEITSKYDERISGMSEDLTDIKELLRLGFRLPDDHQHHSQKKSSIKQQAQNNNSTNQTTQNFVSKAMASQNADHS
ncbi:MAG: MotA/TolQ/ExbB proton channel family protein [Gammaproteobacteria bacterium]|nr:MotA/TolQ/ExbB proton channel family protein [Gammaproteobacteria bacterium]